MVLTGISNTSTGKVTHTFWTSLWSHLFQPHASDLLYVRTDVVDFQSVVTSFMTHASVWSQILNKRVFTPTSIFSGPALVPLIAPSKREMFLCLNWNPVSPPPWPHPTFPHTHTHCHTFWQNLKLLPVQARVHPDTPPVNTWTFFFFFFSWLTSHRHRVLTGHGIRLNGR